MVPATSIAGKPLLGGATGSAPLSAEAPTSAAGSAAVLREGSVAFGPTAFSADCGQQASAAGCGAGSTRKAVGFLASDATPVGLRVWEITGAVACRPAYALRSSVNGHECRGSAAFLVSGAADVRDPVARTPCFTGWTGILSLCALTPKFSSGATDLPAPPAPVPCSRLVVLAWRTSLFASFPAFEAAWVATGKLCGAETAPAVWCDECTSCASEVWRFSVGSLFLHRQGVWTLRISPRLVFSLDFSMILAPAPS